MTVGRDPTAISIGAGTLYVAPLSTAEPASLTGAWAGAWVDLGYTEDGGVFTDTRTTTDLDVAEEYYPLKTVVMAKTGTVAFKLAQITAYNMQVSYAGGTITSPSYVTFEPPDAGTETRLMLGWQSIAADERYVWRQCFAGGATARAMSKTTKSLLDVTFNLEKPPGTTRPWKWWGSAARSGLA